MYATDIKQILANSLKELMENSSVQGISVKQITDNCGLSTRSFYNHFADKYDLANFIYFDVNESAWFPNGIPCNLDQEFSNFLRPDSLSPAVWRNLFKYSGQNSVREFALRKTRSDLCRLFLWNDCASLLQERRTKEVICFASFGLTHMLHDAICNNDPNCVISIDTLLACFPEPMRKVFTADLKKSPVYSRIEAYNPAKPVWPPKLYTCSDRIL